MSNGTVNIQIESKIFEEVTELLCQTPKLYSVNTANQSDKPELLLKDYSETIMEAGTYSIEVIQEVSIKKKVATFKAVQKLEVSVNLKDFSEIDVFNHYPPRSAFGDYTDVLPHIVLKSKSLPWEIPHFSNKKGVPYLALVVLNEDECPTTVKPGSKIKIDKSVLPDKNDLTYLAHVMKTQDGAERSVLIANRLPTPEKNNSVHLIVLDKENKEGMYTSLYNWNFTCEAAKNNFQNMVRNLNTGLLHLPDVQLPEDETDKDKIKQVKQFNKCLQQGFVPLPHFLRTGQRVISWYRGPLTPFDVDVFDKKTAFKLRYINNSDQLLRQFTTSKRLDVTYATAWELGRWLTLEQKEVANALYNWKKRFALTEKQKIRKAKLEKKRNKEAKDFAGIHKVVSKVVSSNDSVSQALPEAVEDWLIELVKLRHIPYANLIPDEHLLPQESMRFFHIDEGWLWALIDGALSIGRQPTAKTNPPIVVEELYLMGCIIRSETIPSFPDMIVTANGKELPLEKRLLGRDILLCVFRSTANLKSVEFFLKPQGTHFGIDPKQKTNADSEQKSPQFVKKFFALKKEKITKKEILVPFKEGDKLVIDIPKFTKEMKTTNKNKSSTFALRMLEASPKVIFKCIN